MTSDREKPAPVELEEQSLDQATGGGLSHGQIKPSTFDASGVTEGQGIRMDRDPVNGLRTNGIRKKGIRAKGVRVKGIRN